MLTQAEYKAIAAELRLPTQAHINGAARPAIGGETFATYNPATGDKLTDVAACDQRDVDYAVEKAREAMDSGVWALMHPHERKQVLIKLCKLVKRNRHELAVMESLDSGKPIADCESIDIPEFIHTLTWHAEAVDKIYDQTAPVGSDAMAMIEREPIGVVAAVLPWNFPLLMLAWKMGPALAAGCSLIVKPAEQTSLTALRIAELAAEAGIPAGVFNVLPGTGVAVGEPLGRHMDIDMVSFTGSTATGRRFLTYSGESNLKKVVLEMGGKNPCIVMDDAVHLDRVAQQVCNGAFWNMGENCSAASRLIVHADIKDALLKRIVERMREWRMGDPLDPQVQLGAMIDSGHFAKVQSYLEQIKSPIAGGSTENGTHIEPTLAEADPDDAVAREEIFGPVLSILTVDSFDEAIAVANDTPYGLAASLFTSDVKRALRGARAIQAGTVTVNCFGEGDITTPFGGYKQSGFGGRDNSIHAHDQYTEMKTIWVDLSDDDFADSVD